MTLIMIFFVLVVSNTMTVLAMDVNQQSIASSTTIASSSSIEAQKSRLFDETNRVWGCFIENLKILKNLRQAENSCQAQLDLIKSQTNNEYTDNSLPLYTMLNTVRQKINMVQGTITRYTHEYKLLVSEYIQISQQEDELLMTLPTSHMRTYLPQAVPGSYNGIPQSQMSLSIEQSSAAGDSAYQANWDKDCPTENEFLLFKKYQELYELDDVKFELFVNFAYEYKQKHKVDCWSRALKKIFEEWCTRHSEEATPYIALQDGALGEESLVKLANDHPTELEIHALQNFSRVHNLNDTQFELLMDIAYRYAEAHNIQLRPRILKRIYQENNTYLSNINKH